MKIVQLSVKFALCLLIALPAMPAAADFNWPAMTKSADGVAISYEVHGAGAPTLVFVHGWSCDTRYWRAQVPYFSEDYRVVVIDLAGHGHSGLGRRDYTMAAFGEDVRAVINDVGAERVILIGHSMGGPVSVAAAQLMPERVIGIIGVDTFQDVAAEMSGSDLDDFAAPLRADFATGAAGFVSGMFVERTNAALRDWVVADMSAAPPEVALSALEAMFADVISGAARAAFAGLDVPVVAINADLWPTNVEANREHMYSFDAVIVEDADHFLHMAKPEVFNRELDAVLTRMVETRAAAP
ncbi:MAG: alpha/beta hydrolase [Gammaproteobacteria bacterium]|nr:alpha/beta hydrolase [Gammaproteobacteria bacterium]